MMITPDSWIEKPDESGDGFLMAWAEDGEEEFPLPIETHNVSPDDVTLGTPQNFSFIFEGAAVIKVYEDLDDYEKTDDLHLAPELFIPSGLFPLDDDEDFMQTPTAIIHGRVIKVYDDPTGLGFESSDILFTMTCLGYEFDCMIPREFSPVRAFSVGNIVSGFFWVQGWPEGM